MTGEAYGLLILLLLAVSLILGGKSAASTREPDSGYLKIKVSEKVKKSRPYRIHD
jgi:hypothetical protein